ncbi:MAG TPA: BTAD domain-containing putative transcriptional regulator [Gaiellaceae bacterium]|nr:BTAD domain-containing putative transcriptional regulator [Gaiellaceae bacterium]
MDFSMLGPLEVRDQGRPLEIGGGKQRALLALLLLHVREVVSVDRIVDALWGETPPASALNSVHIYVSQLRRAIGDGYLETRGQGYMLVLEQDELDLYRFERLFEHGRELLAGGEANDAARTLREALSLWRGPALADVTYASFAQADIARLEELRLAALEERIEADLALGEAAEVIPELEALVRQHPLRERLRGQLMLALYRTGRQADALDVYQDARSTLVEELGLEPGRQLRELEQAILRQDSTLDAPTRPLPRVLSRKKGTSLIAIGAALLLGAAIAVIVVQFARREPGAMVVSVDPDSVIAVDPRTNEVVAEIPVGDHPSQVAAGEGSTWVINGNDRTVSRIDTAVMRVVRTIGLDATPTDVAVGAGAVWIATSENTVLRMDPASGRVERTIELPQPRFSSFRNQARYVEVGARSVWVGAYERGSIWRIDPRSNVVVATIEADAGAIAVGEGAVWVSGYLGVTEIDPDSNTVRETISMSLGTPAIAVGEGAVWVPAGQVWRISPSLHAVAGAFFVAGSNASGVAVGYGSLWVVSSGDGTVSRVDPSTEKLVAQFVLGSPPTDVAVGDGLVWVAVS